MKRLIPRGLAISAIALLCACSTAPAEYTRTAEAQQELDKALAGHVAGKPVSCIPNYRANDMRIIDDWTILFEDGRTTYLQTPRGGCPGIDSHRNTLVTKLRGTNQLCSGDIHQLVDLPLGMWSGSCVFGPFTPYTRPS